MLVAFNEADHSYTLDGVAAPGVSAVLAPATSFGLASKEALEKARTNGKKVHKVIELYELGTLNRAVLHPWLEAHLVQWERFKRELRYVGRFTEQVVWSEKFLFCGTFDGSGHMDGSEFMLDLKTGGKYDVHQMQTAAYKLAAKERGLVQDSCRRGSIYIRPDSYELTIHKRDNADTTAFLGLLNYNRWKREQK